MYKRVDVENGIPSRIYRNPKEIREDIRVISLKIKETNAMLNIREMLLNVLISENGNTPEKLIMELEAALTEAKSAIEELSDLEEELSELEDELSEVRWLLGM